MELASWLADSLRRIEPGSRPTPCTLQLDAARGERVSAQLAVRLDGEGAERNGVAKVALACEPPEGLDVRIRRVGYVPVPHHNTPVLPGHVENSLPGFVGDPLLDETVATLWPAQTQAFWLTVRVSRNAGLGMHRIAIVADFGAGGLQRHTLIVRVHAVTLRPRKHFPVTNWFYADALLDWYKLTMWQAEFWTLAEKYFRNLSEHGQDTLYVPVFTPPLDGVKRPTQLVRVTRTARNGYVFDWSDARRWVRLAAKSGIRNFEFTHLFRQWGAAKAIRVYHGQGHDERALWGDDMPATHPTYRRFLAQFLPRLKQFCEREGILSRSLFHLSDEPHGDEHKANYARAREMLRDLAPWMKVLDALTDIAFAREGLVDMPVPSISTTMDFLREEIACWTYFCCGPRGKFLQRLMDTPLAKIRMSGWLFYRTGVRGFLHWGYNYWYRRGSRQLADPFTVSDAGAAPGWAYGDPFVVYPGTDGPIDSVRWEVFAESLQDYALMQEVGLPRTDRLLSRLRAYDDFPVSAAWIRRARARLFAVE